MDQKSASPRLIEYADALVRAVARLGVSANFVRFCIVGTAGFCWDTGTVYLLRHPIGIYLAGTAGFFVAATANWALNRAWTFRGGAHGAMHRQWAKFILANLGGFIINRGLFFTLVTIDATCRANPVLPIIAGSAAGLLLNYFLSKRFVFS